MYDSLIFYNHFGAGDLFETREFIKDIMRNIESKEYYFCHSKHRRMFDDIPDLKYNPVDSRMKETSPFLKQDNMLFINTWIGQNSKYVLPQVGCVIDKSYEMFNDILSGSGHRRLQGHLYDYIPQVDFSKFQIKHIDKFLKKNKNFKVLVCNGTVNSMQADNFDINNPIKIVASENPKKTFITTNRIHTNIPNIVYSGDIINADDGFDLNEISYLAKYMDVIVGRKSGPFVFAHNKDVWNSDKRSLSFTYAKHSSHFILSDDLPLRKFWSPDTDINKVIERIQQVINE